MTIAQIQKRVSAHLPASRATIYRLLDKAKIKPLGARTRPRLYPDSAPVRILAHLGIVTDVQERFEADSRASRGIPSMRVLSATSKRARKARAGK